MTTYRSTLVATLAAAALAASFSSANADPVTATPMLSPPSPTSQSAADITSWRKTYMEEAGMMPVGATGQAMEYAVGGSFSLASTGLVRGWMRWEEFSPVTVSDRQTRSMTQLLEVDCQGGRGRLLALDLYPYNNLQGAPQHVDAQEPEWSYARPGTVLEQNIALMCTAARSVVARAMQAQATPSPQIGLPSRSMASLASIR